MTRAMRPKPDVPGIPANAPMALPREHGAEYETAVAAYGKRLKPVPLEARKPYWRNSAPQDGTGPRPREGQWPRKWPSSCAGKPMEPARPRPAVWTPTGMNHGLESDGQIAEKAG